VLHKLDASSFIGATLMFSLPLSFYMKFWHQKILILQLKSRKKQGTIEKQKEGKRNLYLDTGNG
jgi:hypothetical protein